jgi:hypothetical protein
MASVRDDLTDEFPLLVNTGLAMFRIAPPREAEETLLRALRRSRQYAFALGETNVTLTLARLYWSTERLEECMTCHRQVRELIPHGADGEIVVDYCILGSRLAIAQGRFNDAAAYISRARSDPHAQFPLPDLQLCCCELDLRLATTSDAVNEGELNELLLRHLQARGFGLQDEVMSTVLKCLDRNGRSDVGTRLLEEYVREHRRDGFPVPSWLRTGRSVVIPSAVQEMRLRTATGVEANA